MLQRGVLAEGQRVAELVDQLLRLAHDDQIGERRAALAPGGDVVGQKSALCGRLRMLVDLAVDGLEAERAHPDVVRARIAERDPRRGLLAQDALLVGESGPYRLQKGPAGLHAP